MKKAILVMGLFALSLQTSYAQFDFITGALGNIGDALGGASGIMNTKQDLAMLKEAVELVDVAICAVQDFECESPDIYTDLVDGCAIPTGADMSMKILDNSLTTLAGELAKASSGVGGAIGGMLGGSKPEPMNREAIRAAINDAKVEIEKNLHCRMVRQKLDDKFMKKILQINEELVAQQSIMQPGESPFNFSTVSDEERQVRERAKQEMDNSLSSIKKFKEKVIAFFFVIMLIGGGWTITKDPTKFSPEYIWGTLIGLVVFSIINALWT